MAAAGLVSFTSMFALAWFTKKTPASPVDNSSQIPTTRPETDVPLPSKEDAITLLAGTNDKAKKTTMTEKQLKNLIYEVQDKIKEYNDELQALELREQRLQIAQDTIKKDLLNLNNLRIELASTVASLKEQRDKLLKSRIEIAQSEKANIIKIAATYDKMESASASKILTNLCKSETQNSVSTKNSNMNDAVKILYYMTDRTKAKLLADLVTSEPELAAVLCQKLKEITEKNG
jgi:hypothetical protein